MKAHQPFLSRPDYHTKAPLSELRAAAKAARAAGYYNIATLWQFRQCWRQSGKLTDYLNYLAFRRDLGYPVNAQQLKRLTLWFKSPFSHMLWCLRHPHARALKRKLLQNHNQTPIENLQFKQYLQQAKHIQVVGNSGELKGQALGQVIDQADIVVRFNRCFSDVTTPTDTGYKTNIWVGAPDFKLAAPATNWYVIAGPDMLNWINTLPPAFANSQMIVSVPLTNWRSLVRQLAAPPSAGILTLNWLSQLAPIRPIRIFGFSFATSDKPYHQADPNHQAVSRHNWPAEQQLLRMWQDIKLIETEFKE